MGQYNLIVLRPRPTKPVNGVLYIDKYRIAQFYPGDGGEKSRSIASLERVDIESASSQGILLSGFETARKACRYQEWWLVHAREER